MSHMFCVTRRRLAKDVVERLDAIVKEESGETGHVAGFVYIGKRAGETSTGWAYSPDYPMGLGDRLAARVRARVAEEGIEL